MTDYVALRREANERGMRDFERGASLAQNPYPHAHATGERAEWAAGWDNARQLRMAEGHRYYALQRLGRSKWIAIAQITYDQHATTCVARADVDLCELLGVPSLARVVPAERMDGQKNFAGLAGASPVFHKAAL